MNPVFTSILLGSILLSNQVMADGLNKHGKGPGSLRKQEIGPGHLYKETPGPGHLDKYDEGSAQKKSPQHGIRLYREREGEFRKLFQAAGPDQLLRYRRTFQRELKSAGEGSQRQIYYLMVILQLDEHLIPKTTENASVLQRDPRVAEKDSKKGLGQTPDSDGSENRSGTSDGSSPAR